MKKRLIAQVLDDFIIPPLINITIGYLSEKEQLHHKFSVEGLLPNAIAGYQNKLYIIDTHSQLHVFDFEGKQTLNQHLDGMANCSEIAINEDIIYAVTFFKDEISLFNLEGKLLEIWKNNQERTFFGPLSLTIQNGNIIMSDQTSGSIFFLNKKGRVIRKIDNLVNPTHIITLSENLFFRQYGFYDHAIFFINTRTKLQRIIIRYPNIERFCLSSQKDELIVLGITFDRKRNIFIHDLEGNFLRALDFPSNLTSRCITLFNDFICISELGNILFFQKDVE